MTGDTKSILLVGVGGQGIIRASDILSVALMHAGYDVKKSEVHGMAQRGGCVSSHVRYGQKVYSPLAKEGGVDILLSFEKLETLRYLHYLGDGGTIIINDAEILPPAVNLGEQNYPSGIYERIEAMFSDVISIDAYTVARHEGNIRMANTVMLGVLASRLDISDSVWETVFTESFHGKIAEQNLQAFRHARNA